MFLTGCLFLVIGGYQFIKSEIAQKASLTEAKALLKQDSSLPSAGKTTPKQAAESVHFSPKTGETLGILSIPKISAELPIVEGTDEDELEKGVGHYSGTALPGEQDQIVLSGHRDTVFRRMGELKIGDQLIVQLPYGEFVYQIEETDIVSADDTSVIQSQPEEVLTVTTCYPFGYLGNAPDRYIITARPAAE